MNYNYMFSLIKVELNKQLEEIKQYLKDEYDRGYRAGFSDGYDIGERVGWNDCYSSCKGEG